jgi:hypothetical protein
MINVRLLWKDAHGSNQFQTGVDEVVTNRHEHSRWAGGNGSLMKLGGFAATFSD